MNILLQWIAGVVARIVRTLDFWLMLRLYSMDGTAPSFSPTRSMPVSRPNP